MTNLEERLDGVKGQGVERAPAAVSTATVVREAIDRQVVAFKAVLPDDVDVERYSRLVLTAVKANPKLMTAFTTPQGQTSVLLSAMMAAALGLEPNTPTQECWLQPRGVKGADGRWTEECELSIGYKGFAKLARRSGEVRELFADVVREGDEFEFERGLQVDVFRHKRLAADDAPLTHAYAIARLTNGGTAWVVLNRAQVEKRRAMSESYKNDKARPYSPWTKWPEEQWRKTAMRNLLTHGEVPLSPELAQAASGDERPLRIDDDGTIDAESSEEPIAALPAVAGTAPVEPPLVAPEDVEEDWAPSDIDLAKAAATAFPLDDAPKGTKTKQRDRLRYALTWAATNRRTVHLNELHPAERRQLQSRLKDITEGRMSFDCDETFVVFKMTGSGVETAVRWADFEVSDDAG